MTTKYDLKRMCELLNKRETDGILKCSLFPSRLIQGKFFLMLDVVQSGVSTESKLESVFQWTMKILNVLVVIGAIYAGSSIANSMFGLSGDDHYAGKPKGKIIALVSGLIVWFGIQIIIGDIGNLMK